MPVPVMTSNLEYPSSLAFWTKSRLVVQGQPQFHRFFRPQHSALLLPKYRHPGKPGRPGQDILSIPTRILWIPTNNGLWRIDIERGSQSHREDGFSDFRFTSI